MTKNEKNEAVPQGGITSQEAVRYDSRIVDYPKWDFKTKQAWLRDTRKNWFSLRKVFNAMYFSYSYYPQEVVEWLDKFYEMDDRMKEYYRKAS